MSNTSQQRARRRISALVGLLTLSAFLLPVPPQASARPQDGALSGSGYTVDLPATGRGWYGAYHLGETTAFCVDLDSGPPRQASGWTERTGTDLRKQAGWGAGPGSHGGSDVTVSDTELAQVAWALHTVGQNPAPALAAATEHLVRLLTILGPEQEAREASRWSAVLAAHPEAAAEFDALSARAAASAGPYRIHAEWLRRPTSQELKGSLLVDLVSASGEPMPGVAIGARGLGGVVVSDTESTTSPDGRAVLGVEMPDPGEAGITGTVEVTVNGLPAARPRLFVPDEPSVQRMVAAGPPESLHWREELHLAPPNWHPQVHTRTRDPLALPGQDAVDLITVTGGRPGAAFSGTSSLYGPFKTLEEMASSSQETAPLVGTAAFAGVYGPDGGAHAESTSLTFVEPGFYTWVEELEDAPLTLPPESPTWPQKSETALVIAPGITSVLAAKTGTARTVLPDTEVTDSITVSGVPADRAVPASTEQVRVVVSGRLLGPVAPRGVGRDADCQGIDWSEAPVVSSYEDIVLSDDSMAGLLPSRLTAEGCYTATARLEVGLGSSPITSVEHPAGLPEQTLLVRSPEIAHAAPEGPRISAGTPKAPVQWSLLLMAIIGVITTATVSVADRIRT